VPNTLVLQNPKYYEEGFKDMMGEYQITAKRLEKSLEKTRQEMVKIMKGVSLRKSINGSTA
jgi:hypothetical protein